MPILTLTKDNFDQTIAQNNLIIVDFWANWCAPCKTFSKVLEAAAEKYKDVVFGSVDIEAEPELANDFEVRSVPLILVLRESVIIFAESGALPAAALDTLIQQAKALDMKEVHKRLQEADKK